MFRVVRPTSWWCALLPLRSVALINCSLLAAIAAGCTAADNVATNHPEAPVNQGPLAGGGGDPGRLCLPSRSGTGMYSLDVVENLGSESVTVDRLRLVQAQNLELLDTYLVPLGEGGGSAGSSAYPPPREELNGSALDWTSRTALKDATLVQGDGRFSVAVGVALVDDSAPGEFRALEIDYHAEDAPHRLRTSTAFVLAPPSASCQEVQDR